MGSIDFVDSGRVEIDHLDFGWLKRGKNFLLQHQEPGNVLRYSLNTSPQKVAVYFHGVSGGHEVVKLWNPHRGGTSTGPNPADEIAVVRAGTSVEFSPQYPEFYVALSGALPKLVTIEEK